MSNHISQEAALVLVECTAATEKLHMLLKLAALIQDEANVMLRAGSELTPELQVLYVQSNEMVGTIGRAAGFVEARLDVLREQEEGS